MLLPYFIFQVLLASFHFLFTILDNTYAFTLSIFLLLFLDSIRLLLYALLILFSLLMVSLASLYFHTIHAYSANFPLNFILTTEYIATFSFHTTILIILLYIYFGHYHQVLSLGRHLLLSAFTHTAKFLFSRAKYFEYFDINILLLYYFYFWFTDISLLLWYFTHFHCFRRSFSSFSLSFWLLYALRRWDIFSLLYYTHDCHWCYIYCISSDIYIY